MTFQKFIATYEGKKIDYDKSYGVQCVDLIKLFIDKVLGIEPQAIGNAIDYYKKRNKLKYLKDNFTAYDFKSGFKFKPGDIIVMQGSSAYGHIAVCTGDYDKKGVYAFDENYKGSGAGMTKRFFEYNGPYKIKCILRPKNQKNLKGEIIKYYPAFKGVTVSIVDALRAVGEKDTSFVHRVNIARLNGIKMYTGTASQNIKMLKLLRNGKLIQSKK